MAIHPYDWSFAELAAGLRESAAGRYADEAGIELLIAHRVWLVRLDFRRLIDCMLDEAGAPFRAWIAWDLVNEACLPSSLTEKYMLRLAASICAGYPVSLHEVLGSLDEANITAVVAAVLHANGYRATTVLLSCAGEGMA